MAIARDPVHGALYTGRSDLVAVVTNGTAVLGLGAIGPLQQRKYPVHGGQRVCCSKLLGGVNAFDIDLDAPDMNHFIDVVAALEPSFGGINLEDIKAPECFRDRGAAQGTDEKFPVMHDDQHGTAVVVAAALRNALYVTGRDIATTRLVIAGADCASAIACLDLLVEMGMSKKNIFSMLDRRGLVHRGRNELDKYKGKYAQDVELGSWEKVMEGADVLIGLSEAERQRRPGPSEAYGEAADRHDPGQPDARDHARDHPARTSRTRSWRTGRSDYPNQVNTALCFPFIFRAALDCGATAITEEMKLACAMALSDLARATPPDGDHPGFGPQYLIPDVLDPRLLPVVAATVVMAAVRSKVATRPIPDIDAYKLELRRCVFLRPSWRCADRSPHRVRAFRPPFV